MQARIAQYDAGDVTPMSHALSPASSAGAPRAETLFWLSFTKAFRHFAHIAANDPLPSSDSRPSSKEGSFQPMHVVRRGETILKIAQACCTTVAAVYVHNPEIPEGSEVAVGDCIALPCHTEPRLHYTMPGETLMR